MANKNFDEIYDFIIIGSGFGGSVSAMRLAEKGYRVAVLEEGKRWRPQDFAKTNWNLKRYLWAPIIRCFGIQALTFIKGVTLLHGKGVGGGSLVYANTLMKPTDEVLSHSDWPNHKNFNLELAPHFEIAKKMLGVTTNPMIEIAESALLEVGKKMNCADTFHATDVAIYFGDPSKEVADPYFGGKGPARKGCNGCGGCMVGCRYNAKNTLDKNYLYFAEKAGAEVIAETKVKRITPMSDGSYQILAVPRISLCGCKKIFRAKKVIVAAGVLGSTELLFRNRDQYKTLPNISRELGRDVRTNGECLLGCTSLDSTKNYSKGIAIGAAIHPDKVTKIEAVKYSSGSSFMRFLAVPLTGDGTKLTRPLKFLWQCVVQFHKTVRLLFVKDWAKQSVILLNMQSIDTKIQLHLKNFFLFRKLAGSNAENTMPSYIPVAQTAAQELAHVMNGVAQNVITEVLLATPTTAHILGGCRMATSHDKGVVNDKHEVFGYPGLYVCDGSVIPVNLAVNPSLTITALAERFASQFTAKNEPR